MPTILVVEDEADMVELLQLMLRMEPYTMLTAPDGETALEIVHEQLPDLILLDLMMPGMGGAAFYDELRSYEATADIPVIIVTAHTSFDPEERDYWMERGAKDYVIKPFAPADLIERIRVVLNS
jgi:two-component system alkaline phosphatase synthesis response regulator PhoP